MVTKTKKKTAGPRRRRGWLTKGRVIGAGVVTGALVLAGVGTAWANAAGSASGYRTATAETGSVDEALTLSGSLASATRRDRAFGASGTVTAVNVKLGDTVAAGDVLAAIDDADLQDAVDSAESKLADAEQTLADDLDSQTSTSSSSSSGGGTSPAGASGGTGGTGSADAAVAAAVETVVAAQQNLLTLAGAADTALADAQSSLADAGTVCQPFLDATLVDETDDAGDEETGDEGETEPADAEDSATPLTLAAVQELLVACQEAVSGVGDTQTAVDAAQAAVEAAMADLDNAVTALRDAVAASSGDSGSGSGSSPSAGSSSSSSGSSSSALGGSGSSTQVASAADIVADRAAIAVADADLAIAQHDLTAASLTTPIAGTVAFVGFAVGDDVTTGSTTQLVTIIGDDGYTMSATVNLSQIAKVQVGQTGTAVITSSGASYAATVSSVGLVNVSTSSTPAYEVEIAIDPAGATLLNGAAVEATISIAAAEDVLTIPLSALHVDGTRYTVQELVDGELTSAPVEVGAIGSERVEITSGLAAGDEVVIADLGADITSEESTTSSGLTGFGGGGGTFTSGGGTFPGGGQGGPPSFG